MRETATSKPVIPSEGGGALARRNESRDLLFAFAGIENASSSRLRSLLALTISCASKPDPNTLVMIIESSPTNLDPRVGLDAQSERIDDLIFDDLLTRGTTSTSPPAWPNAGTFPIR